MRNAGQRISWLKRLASSRASAISPRRSRNRNAVGRAGAPGLQRSEDRGDEPEDHVTHQRKADEEEKSSSRHRERPINSVLVRDGVDRPDLRMGGYRTGSIRWTTLAHILVNAMGPAFAMLILYGA
jgi:hypothetical protein